MASEDQTDGDEVMKTQILNRINKALAIILAAMLILVVAIVLSLPTKPIKPRDGPGAYKDRTPSGVLHGYGVLKSTLQTDEAFE